MGKIILHKICLNLQKEGKIISIDLNRYSIEQNSKKNVYEINKNKEITIQNKKNEINYKELKS